MIKPRKIQQQKLTLNSAAVRAVTPNNVKAVVQAGCWWQEVLYVLGKKENKRTLEKNEEIKIKNITNKEI